MAVDFNYFLQQKYAQLQQQADATTSNAASTAITANANANAANAAAGLDVARTSVLPAATAAEIGLQRSQANLTNQQAAVVVPEATARIGSIEATTAGQTLQNRDFTRTHLTGVFGGAPGSLPSLTSSGPVTVQGPGDQLAIPAIGATPSPTAQRPGESYAAWTARLRGLGYGS